MSYPDPYWLALIIISLIVIIAIICLIIFTSNRHLNQSLGQFCDNVNYFCSDTTTCQNKVCLSNLGQYCQSLSDCVSGSTACYQQSCTDVGLGSVNQPHPCQSTFIVENNVCKSPIGGFCQTLNDCVSNATQCTQVLGQLTCVSNLNGIIQDINSSNSSSKKITNIYSMDDQIIYPNLASYDIIDMAENNNTIYILS